MVSSTTLARPGQWFSATYRADRNSLSRTSPRAARIIPPCGTPMNPRKLLKKALAGPENLAFRDLLTLARAFGFQLIRTSGSHPILGHPNIPEQLNFQEVGGKAKPYQFRQFLKVVE